MARDLATRVAGNAETQQQQANGTRPAPTVYQLIESGKAEIARALPKHMDADRLARIAITVIRQTPKLGECSPASLVGALMTAAQLGLELGPLGEAYLVPFGREVTFIPGYRGLIKLAWQSNQLLEFSAKVVYQEDDFDYEFGLDAFLKHKPARGDRGKPTEVYAVAKFKNGGHAFEVMSVADVEKIRKRSRAANAGPWVTDWDAMAKKTVVKQLMKFLPLSTELRDVATAAALDGSIRNDISSAIDEIPASTDYQMIEGQVVDTASGEVLGGGEGPTPEDIAAMAAEMASDPPDTSPPTGLFAGDDPRTES